MIICESCGEEYDDGLDYCPHCLYYDDGSRLEIFDGHYQDGNCPVCNDPISSSWIFCPGCGTSID